MKPKSIKSFVVKSFFSETYVISFSYKKLNFLLTCVSRIRIDSEKTGCDLVVRVHGVNASMGTIDYLFSVDYRDFVFDKKNINSLVNDICIELDNK